MGPDGTLVDYHYGEGAYAECELAICELLGVACEPLAPLRPEDAPGALLAPPSPDRLGEPFSGPYEAGGVWAVLDGAAAASAPTGASSSVEHPGAYLLVEHERHSAGELTLELGRGVRCDGVCFTPGLCPERSASAGQDAGANVARVAVGEQRQQARRAGVLDEDRRARPVGALGVAREGPL